MVCNLTIISENNLQRSRLPAFSYSPSPIINVGKTLCGKAKIWTPRRSVWNAFIFGTPKICGFYVRLCKKITLCNIAIITAQKIKFSVKDFSSKFDQIPSFLRIWSHLLKKSFNWKLQFLCSAWRKKPIYFAKLAVTCFNYTFLLLNPVHIKINTCMCTLG